MKKKIKLKNLTKEQYQKWLDEHCNLSNCKKCIFNNIFCQIGSSCCWIDYKNYCSKKFLNKKIRIEVEKDYISKKIKFVEMLKGKFKIMTKDEIKKASAEDLAKRWLDLLFERINIQSTSYDNLLKLKYPDYVKYVMKQNKVFKRNIKESNLILRLRTEVSNLLNMIKREDVKIPVPFPGYYIKEYLHEEKIAYEDFADDLGIEEIELIALLNGNIKINEELALKLSELIGTSAEVWLNLQKTYDESIEGDK